MISLLSLKEIHFSWKLTQIKNEARSQCGFQSLRCFLFHSLQLYSVTLLLVTVVIMYLQLSWAWGGFNTVTGWLFRRANGDVRFPNILACLCRAQVWY